MTDTNTSNALVTINNDHALTWTTKKGATKTAHSPSAKARAPRATQLGDADALTLSQLTRDMYRPFLRDVHNNLSKAHLDGLKNDVKQALTVQLEGTNMVPTGDILAIVNKKAAIATAKYLANPTVTVKGVSVSKPLAKGLTYLTTIASQWLADMQQSAIDKALAKCESIVIEALNSAQTLFDTGLCADILDNACLNEQAKTAYADTLRTINEGEAYAALARSYVEHVNSIFNAVTEATEAEATEAEATEAEATEAEATEAESAPF